tara:strand:- start:3782 stop:4474 length:693 start_codon:yes stop_codon:yes gene_type:complete
MINDTWGMSTRKKRRKYSIECNEDNDEDVVSDKSSKKKNPCLAGNDSDKHVWLNGNHIYFYAGVTKTSVYKLNEKIVELNTEFEELQQSNPKITMTPEPIMLHINSYGGSVFAAFAAVDMIMQSKIPIHTIVEGATASSGTIMSVVGKKRYIRPHASMLIHQLSSWIGGKMTEVEESMENLEQMMQSIKDIYLEHTKLRGRKLDELLKHDLWWKPNVCLEYGLVDEIYKV